MKNFFKLIESAWFIFALAFGFSASRLFVRQDYHWYWFVIFGVTTIYSVLWFLNIRKK